MDAVAQRQLRALLEQYQNERADWGWLPITVDRLIEELEEPPSVQRIPDFTQDELQAMREWLEDAKLTDYVNNVPLMDALDKLKAVTDAPR